MGLILEGRVAGGGLDGDLVSRSISSPSELLSSSPFSGSSAGPLSRGGCELPDKRLDGYKN